MIVNKTLGQDEPKEGGRRRLENATGNRAVSPLISVITVVYNGAERLRTTIESVLRQGRIDIEHIVVDGGSTDGTLSVLADFDAQLDYWVSEPDSGIYDAMNKALALCTGAYVHFLNAGDSYSSPHVLGRVSRLLELRPALLMNRVTGIELDGGHTFLPRKLGLNTDRQRFDSAYCHQGAFAQTTLLQAVGFDRSYPHFADFHALMRIRQECPDVLETSEVVVDFPLDGVSSNWRKAPELYSEKERLLADLGEGSSTWRYLTGLLRAHLYRLKMAIRSA